MSIKQLLVISLMCTALGFAFGHNVGTDQQFKTNNQLKREHDQLRSNYDLLETEYQWQIETCLQQLGDADYDVNNDGEINSLDLLELQKYILNN